MRKEQLNRELQERDTLIAELRQTRDMAITAATRLQTELRGAQLVSYVLLRRAGGLATITQQDFTDAAGGKLAVRHEESTGGVEGGEVQTVWHFEAQAPEAAAEEASSETSPE